MNIRYSERVGQIINVIYMYIKSETYTVIKIHVHQPKLSKYPLYTVMIYVHVELLKRTITFSLRFAWMVLKQ